MDKSELCYVITQGTNSRVLDDFKEPVIFLPNHVDVFIGELEKEEQGARPRRFEKITIEDYEIIFGE